MKTYIQRNSEEESKADNKRSQHDFQGSNSKNVIATLLSLIPEREQKIQLTDIPKVSVGRSRSCNIALSEPDISTIHAELFTIEVQINGIKRKMINITDKSRNGTFINGDRLIKKDYVLKNGDKIVFGKSCSYLFKYVATTGHEEPQTSQTQASQNTQNSDYDGVFRKPLFSSQVTSKKVTRTREQQPRSFFDKYMAGKELGTGHYAVVKEARNKGTGEIVAVKIFHPQQNDDDKRTKKFTEETAILLSVQHPNIVKLIDRFVEPVSKTQIQTYLVLEKINDGELFDRIVRKNNLREQETKSLFKQLLSGLQYLHGRNIIHRDIKPENILLSIRKRTSPEEIALGPWDDDEIDIQVKIADFGLAKFTGEMKFTNTLCGTPSYVAPEVLTKTGYTSRVDMWSAGVLLYVCLCGFPPFSEQLAPPNMKDQILQGKFAFYSPYWDNIDDLVLHLISNLLVVNPAKRYSVDDVLNHLWFTSDNGSDTNKAVMRSQVDPDRLPKTFSELSNLQNK
ncbi:unnamed protein product [Kluyveromyces dobzhanskii CBS 2104]|uniref:WGS project CCBQ000000000 data, contig 00106 n=1 Tax=Kluyveromyces dobzhanskii CBS 2104 TaxID=1427455 RepID=A0A0A8L7E8_9SACH|nr:unnamed protein product [Kluyveromyces dobzhanskii CBS 2104]